MQETRKFIKTRTEFYQIWPKLKHNSHSVSRFILKSFNSKRFLVATYFSNAFKKLKLETFFGGQVFLKRTLCSSAEMQMQYGYIYCISRKMSQSTLFKWIHFFGQIAIYMHVYVIEELISLSKNNF